MSDLIIIHRSFQSSSTSEKDLLKEPTFLMWETCRRQIFFSEDQRVHDFNLSQFDEVYYGIEAEEFLIQVLCGLKSPLVGETEVFGQFKNWWRDIQDVNFKNKFNSSIQQIFSVVKKTREENLCGLGSQSYGSLLRKKLGEAEGEDGFIDFIGAGQLVEEMVPWIEKKWAYRVWCRDAAKVQSTSVGIKAEKVLNLAELESVSTNLVIAAPISNFELESWITQRQQTKNLSVYDMRRDSMTYDSKSKFKAYFNLDELTSIVTGQYEEIQNQIQKAHSSIAAWKAEAEKRAYVRPFGWDDL